MRDLVTALLAEDTVRRWGGLTCSGVVDLAVIGGVSGAFWDERMHGWIVDPSVLVLIDAPEEQESACLAFAARLHDLAAHSYAGHGQPQRRLWLSVQPVTLVHEAREV